MEVRKKEIEELQSQAQALSQEGKSTDEVDSKRHRADQVHGAAGAPLNERKQNLLGLQGDPSVQPDVEDEIVSAFLTWPAWQPGLPLLYHLTPPQSLGGLSCHSPAPCVHTKYTSGFLSSFLRVN